MNYYEFDKEKDSGFDGLRNYVPPSFNFSRNSIFHKKELEISNIRNSINQFIIPYTKDNKKLVFEIISDNLSLKLLEMFEGKKFKFNQINE